MTIIPAIGKDYKKKSALLADFEANKDFRVADTTSTWDGKPVNRANLLNADVGEVKIYYSKLRRSIMVQLPQTTTE